MNLDLILSNLGLQHKCSQMREKNVTSKTFSQMDGSAKQIIDISAKLGLTAEEVVKIKAQIEDQFGTLADPVQQLQRNNLLTRQNQQNYTKMGRNFNQFRTHLAPIGAKSVDLRHAQKSQGQLMFGQKGSLMKQLDYGRKNRIQKLVNSTSSFSPNAQNLARKSAHYQHGGLNQLLISNRQPKLQNTIGKLSQQKDMFVNRQQSEKLQSVMKQTYIEKPLHAEYQSHNQMATNDATVNGIGVPKDSSQFKNDNSHQQSIQMNCQIVEEQVNQTEQPHNDDSHQNINPGFDGNQKQMDGFQAINPFEKSANTNDNANEQKYEIKDQNNQLLTENENKGNRLEYYQELVTRQSQEYLSDKLQRVQDEQQDLEAKLFKNQTDLLQSQTLISNDKHTEDNNTAIENTKLEVANEVEMSEQSQFNNEIQHQNNDQSCGQQDQDDQQNYPFMQHIQTSYAPNQSETNNLVQSQTMLSKQQQLSPSQSDLIDPDNRCENEQLGNYNDYDVNQKQTGNTLPAYDEHDQLDKIQSDGTSDFQQNQLNDQQQDVNELNDSDQDQEDSNSKLSYEEVSEQQYNKDQQFNDAQINSQSQHHSRPTIGMKQPAQHFVSQMPQSNNHHQVKSIPSEEYSSSQNDQDSENDYQQKFHGNNLASQNPLQIDNDNASCSQDYNRNLNQEADSEFMDNITPRDHLNQFQDNQLNDQSSDSDQFYKNTDINQDKIYNGIDKRSDEDYSEEVNYDDQQMPDDTEYNKKVQLLHENRQKNLNAQQLWASSRQNLLTQQSNPQIQKTIQETTTNQVNDMKNQIDNEEDTSRYNYNQQDQHEGQTNQFNGQFAQGQIQLQKIQQVNNKDKQTNQSQVSKDMQQQSENHMIIENQVDKSYSNKNQSIQFEDLPFAQNEKPNTQQIQYEVLEKKSNQMQPSLNQSVNYDNQNDMLKNSSQNTFVDGAAIGSTDQNAFQDIIQQYQLLNKQTQKQVTQNNLPQLQINQVINQIGAIQRSGQTIQANAIKSGHIIPKYADFVVNKQLVNKEVDAQDDLKSFMIFEAVEVAKEATRKEVTEEVSKIVTQQVTDKVTQVVTQDVTTIVRNQTQLEMRELHQKNLQALKDQYEQSAQHQNRREEKLHHQIGILESAVTDTQKQLEENNQQKNQLNIEKNELLAQINNLKENIAQNYQELKKTEEQNEQAKQKHFSTIQQLIQEQHQDRSNIVIFRTQIQNLNDEIDQNQKNIAELKIQLENKQEQLSNQDSKYKKLDSEYKSMQEEVNQKETSIDNLNLQIQQIKASYEELEKQSQFNQDTIKAKAQQTEQQLHLTLNEVKKERDQIIAQKDNLQKQLEQAENQAKLAIQREQQLLNQQKEREEQMQQEAFKLALRQAEQNTPKQQNINNQSSKIMTPLIQGVDMELQVKNEFQSAKTYVENTIARTSILSPQKFQTEQKCSPVQNEQIQRDLQLKQQKLQQLIELQIKQDELKKLQQLQMSNQSKNAQSPYSQGEMMSTPKPQHQISATSHLSSENEQESQKFPKDMPQQYFDQTQRNGKLSTDSQQKLLLQKNCHRNEQVPVVQVEASEQIDDANCENYEQDQDEDNFLHTSGSKHRMPINKEESSFLPDCVVVEKEKKKKIIKKVRFHDDETLIDSNPKTGQDQVINQNTASNLYNPATVTQFTKTEITQDQIQSIGVKRMRSKNNDDQIEHPINDNSASQEILSASQGNEISSQQFNITNDLQSSKISEKLVSLNRTNTDTNQIQQETNAIKVDPQQKAYQFGGYKRQRTAVEVDKQLNNPEELKNIYHIAGDIEGTNLHQGHNEQALTKSTTGRQQLRRKTYQEDAAEYHKTKEDDDEEEFKSDKKSLRKKKNQTQSRGRSLQNQQRTSKGHNTAGDHAKANTSGGNIQHKGGAAKHNQSCQQGAGSQLQASDAIEQKFKQFVGQNDQYLKKNPTLMSLIQKMSRK